MDAMDGLRDGAALIKKDFQLAEDVLNPTGEEVFDYDFVLKRLTKIVSHLLSTDFNQLVNVLYRIDVSEEKLKEALAIGSNAPAKTIAEMIIKRELQKVAFRKKYKQG